MLSYFRVVQLFVLCPDTSSNRLLSIPKFFLVILVLLTQNIYNLSRAFCRWHTHATTTWGYSCTNTPMACSLKWLIIILIKLRIDTYRTLEFLCPQSLVCGIPPKVKSIRSSSLFLNSLMLDNLNYIVLLDCLRQFHQLFLNAQAHILKWSICQDKP